MNKLLRLEDIAKFFLAFAASFYLDYAWWLFLAWLLAPDLGMIGYAVNNRTGAWLYNLLHHQAVAIVVGGAGLALSVPALQLAGLVLFGHSAMDRALGYGLKFEDHFQHTHLGWIGKMKDLQARKASS